MQALDEINAQMQRYLLVQLVASIAVGLATGAAFALMGLKHAAVWGVAAGVLNLVPYVGSIVVTGAAALVAFLQFGEADMALVVAGSSLLINTVEGYLLVPWATSKASSMNPVAVFIGVLAWGWLWGVWGLLLGIPHPDGGQGGVRPRGPPEADRGAAGDLAIPGGDNIAHATEPTEQAALPDHLSVDPRSPHHDAAVGEHDIGIRFNGKERHDVEEYCISEAGSRCPRARPWTARASPC